MKEKIVNHDLNARRFHFAAKVISFLFIKKSKVRFPFNKMNVHFLSSACRQILHSGNLFGCLKLSPFFQLHCFTIKFDNTQRIL